MSMTIFLAPSRSISLTILACFDRGHGQLPTSRRLASSTSTRTVSPLTAWLRTPSRAIRRASSSTSPKPIRPKTIAASTGHRSNRSPVSFAPSVLFCDAERISSPRGMDPARTYARAKVKNLKTSYCLTSGRVGQFADVDPAVTDQLKQLLRRCPHRRIERPARRIDRAERFQRNIEIDWQAIWQVERADAADRMAGYLVCFIGAQHPRPAAEFALGFRIVEAGDPTRHKQEYLITDAHGQGFGYLCRLDTQGFGSLQDRRGAGLDLDELKARCVLLQPGMDGCGAHICWSSRIGEIASVLSPVSCAMLSFMHRVPRRERSFHLSPVAQS